MDTGTHRVLPDFVVSPLSRRQAWFGVNVSPGQRQHLTASHAGIQRCDDERSKMGAAAGAATVSACSLDLRQRAFRCPTRIVRLERVLQGLVNTGRLLVGNPRLGAGSIPSRLTNSLTFVRSTVT